MIPGSNGVCSLLENLLGFVPLFLGRSLGLFQLLCDLEPFLSPHAHIVLLSPDAWKC